MNQVRRPESTEDLQKKAYDELKKKSDDDFDGYAELTQIMLVTFNHVLTKWENANDGKENGDINQLKNAFPNHHTSDVFCQGHRGAQK